MDNICCVFTVFIQALKEDTVITKKGKLNSQFNLVRIKKEKAILSQFKKKVERIKRIKETHKIFIGIGV
jgi:hypothetical protein